METTITSMLLPPHMKGTERMYPSHLVVFLLHRLFHIAVIHLEFFFLFLVIIIIIIIYKTIQRKYDITFITKYYKIKQIIYISVDNKWIMTQI